MQATLKKGKQVSRDHQIQLSIWKHQKIEKSIDFRLVTQYLAANNF